jgi:hypothetical protein
VFVKDGWSRVHVLVGDMQQGAVKEVEGTRFAYGVGVVTWVVAWVWAWYHGAVCPRSPRFFPF